MYAGYVYTSRYVYASTYVYIHTEACLAQRPLTPPPQAVAMASSSADVASEHIAEDGELYPKCIMMHAMNASHLAREKLLPPPLRVVSLPIWSYVRDLRRCEECDERRGLLCRDRDGFWRMLCPTCCAVYVESMQCAAHGACGGGFVAILEAQGRGFAHGHIKGHSRVRCS